MKQRIAIAIAVLMCAAACGAQPTAPTGFAVQQGGTPQGLPICAGGQSNANYMGPSLAAAYPFGAVTVARNSTPLSWWDDNGAMWPDTVACLQRGPLTAFVWWQGEQDALDGVAAEDYGDHLRSFLARVRAAAGQPHLLVVIVQIRLFQPQGYPVYGAAIRSAQARVATEPDNMLLNTDDLPSPSGDVSGAVHLVYPDGYQVEAARIVAAIRARP